VGAQAHAASGSNSESWAENPREKFEIRVELTALRDYSALVRAQAFVTEKTAWLVADIFQEFAP
jgi:hypothetical protein